MERDRHRLSPASPLPPETNEGGSFLDCVMELLGEDDASPARPVEQTRVEAELARRLRLAIGARLRDEAA